MQDILLNKATKDIEITASGDFKIGTSDVQHQELLLILDPGSLKEFPTAPVGASRYLESEDVAAFLREVRTKFSEDGMDVRSIGFDNNKLTLDAPYK